MLLLLLVPVPLVILVLLVLLIIGVLLINTLATKPRLPTALQEWSLVNVEAIQSMLLTVIRKMTRAVVVVIRRGGRTRMLRAKVMKKKYPVLVVRQ